MDKKLKVKDLLEDFSLELLCKDTDLDRLVTVSDLSRPGIELSGFLHITLLKGYKFWEKQRSPLLMDFLPM